MFALAAIQPAVTANLSSQNPKIYAILKKMPNRILGGVLDSGAQRRATGWKSEILKHTGTSLLKQPAVGPAKQITGILMGAETQDSHGKPFVLVVLVSGNYACIYVSFNIKRHINT